MTNWLLDRGRTAALATAAFIALCVSGGGPAVAAPADAPPFDAAPAPGSQTDDAGSYFVVKALPGRRVRQQIVISNTGKRPLTVQVTEAKATTSPLGGVTYAAVREGERAPRVDWLDISRGRVTIGPGAARAVPFSVTLPEDAEPGDRVAGISIQPAPRSAAPGEAPAAGTSASVVVRTRRVVAVQATVPGARRNELRIAGVTADPQADGMYLLVELRNTGTTLLKARGRLEVDADAALDERFSVDTFLPGTTIRYPIRWTDAPEAGKHPTSVSVKYGGRSVDWSGEVRVGARELRGFDDRSGARTSSGRSTGREGAYVAGAAALLVAAAAAVLLLRRRQRARPGSTSKP